MLLQKLQISDSRMQFHRFPVDRRPLLFHPRGQHRSFGDHGGPLYDRGSRVRRGYKPGPTRGGFPLLNFNRPQSIPVSNHLIHTNNTVDHQQPVPMGGNLIVIQPHRPSGHESGGLLQIPQTPISHPQLQPQMQPHIQHNSIVDANSVKSSSAPMLDRSDSQKAKLVLPQDRYHSSSQSVPEVKSVEDKSEPSQKKPKGKLYLGRWVMIFFQWPDFWSLSSSLACYYSSGSMEHRPCHIAIFNE